MFLSNPKSEVTTYSFNVRYPSGLKCDFCQNKRFELSLRGTAGNGNCVRLQHGLTYKFCLQTNSALTHVYVCLYSATKPGIEKQGWLKQFVLCPRGPWSISTSCSHIRSHPGASWPCFELHQTAVTDHYCCSCEVTDWSSFRLPACIWWMCGCFCQSEIEEKETRNLIKTVQADKADSPLPLSLFISV